MTDWDSGFRIAVTVPESARGRPLDVTLEEIRANLEGALDDPRMHQTLAHWLAGHDDKDEGCRRARSGEKDD